MKKIFLLILAGLLVFSLLGCSNNSAPTNVEEQEEGFIPEKMVIGAIPTQNQGDMRGAMDKLGVHLSEKLGTEVEIEVYPDYNGVVEAMNYGQVDMAYFGPLTYIIANETGGAEAIMTLLVNGEPYYYSYMVTHVDSPLDSLEDVIENVGNLQFAFGDVNSTSGSLIPTLELKEKGVFRDQMDTDFKEIFYTGGHDAAALAVQEKKVEVGAVDSAIFEVMKRNGVIDGEQFKIIWQSEPLFQYPWAVKRGTSDELKEALRNAFLTVEDQEILDVFGASGFALAEDKDYEPVRQAAKADGRL
ncbi:phosphate/phosphite/phosphonate ABC transporters, periplasmic binding protein PtxB [Clostridium aceticum]|uniref:Phosphate/phosphite/phosphonate ABC transporters, periplasmic binding protein PtxB n=1 Tax=Clostridium aceticum TaxID=84022 RepID=A0A0D8IH13_9CLOT|nr:phosphate/phosphite/phosphonate ABC transporter substrate-binding protein [Clostridium aceticum]AKL94211.1 phosphate/phosphite/phosphonate ABC transporters, periplasmic binding protein PtxB [Clostridium aceticum]KJF28451.1 phosphonate ABC transporter substrate-binding protein [Clostridium aceticum]